MRAADAGWLLTTIARGGAVDLPPDKDDMLDTLRDAGLLRTAPDPGPERAQLERVRADLARVRAARAQGDSSPELAGRERGLRSAVLELSERLAESEGATEVRRMGTAGGPYRGGASAQHRWQLTQRGRTLLSDLGPRLLRVGDATLDVFDAEMRALREAFAWRARRSAEIAARMKVGELLGRAKLSVPVGLGAVRAEPDRAARAFEATFDAIRRGSSGFTPEQDAAAAECMCLSVSDIAMCERSELGLGFAALRAEIFTQHVPHDPEDALDAAALLTSVPRHQHAARIALARELAEALVARQRRITLSLALIALAAEGSLPPHLPHALVGLDDALARDVPEPMERMAVAVLLSVVRIESDARIERWRTLRQYLARFSTDGMAIAAALLSWVALEPAEILDDLRLASAELTRQRIAGGGAETMTLAIKLLVSMAALAAGNEGDLEERLAYAPVIHSSLPQLGLAGAFAALPLAATAITTFHRTVLDAAAEWERVFHPTHSSFVYGTGRRSHGWG